MHSKIQSLHNALNAAIAGMNPPDLSRGRNEKWSCAEILEHLNLTYIGTIKNLERRLSSGTPAEGDRREKRLQRLLVTRLGYFPKGRKSPERVHPRGMQPEEVVREIFANISRMDQVINDCELRFGTRQPIADHPILGPLTAEEWRGFHVTHGKHHAKQIVRLKNSVRITP